jgi:BlaI family penicillinase repressor
MPAAPHAPHLHLSRRERQIMDALYRLGRASASEIHRALPDPPSYSAVRALLRILEGKGHVRHEIGALRYVYLPTVGRERARRSALRHLVDTFFDGSPERAVAALLDASAAELSADQLDRLAARIEQARKEGA